MCKYSAQRDYHNSYNEVRMSDKSQYSFLIEINLYCITQGVIYNITYICKYTYISISILLDIRIYKILPQCQIGLSIYQLLQ